MSKISIIMTVIVLSLTVTACKHEDDNGQIFPNAVTDVDGNKYDAVKIGDQIWMKSNLRTKHFRDGQPIPKGDQNVYSHTAPYYYQPTSREVPSYNKKTFGLYYNWPAVADARGLCPNGWHVPSDMEWTELVNYVKSKPEFVYGPMSVYIVKSLASQLGWKESSEEWCPGNNPEANNATGFSAYPAGSHLGAAFVSSGAVASFWSSTEGEDILAWRRYMSYDGISISRYNMQKGDGLSIRCIHD